MNTLEIEIDGACNEHFHFRPLGRSIRGRFDLVRESEPLAMMSRGQWPMPIPSQRVGIDENCIGYVSEPLHDPEHSATRDKIQSKGMQLPPARETFAAIDVTTWLYWLKRAVESGLAKITKGKLPDKIEGEPQKSFITTRPPVKKEERLAAALEEQNKLMAQILTKLTAKN